MPAAWLAGQADSKVRLLLNEMLAPLIARERRGRGHDVETISRPSARKAPSDHEIMELARQEPRAVVTNNPRDYRPLHHEAVIPGGPDHDGMIFIPGDYRPTRADTGRIVAALEVELADDPGDQDLASG